MTDRTQYRMKAVLARSKKLRRRRERWLLFGLLTSCLLLTVSLAGTIGASTSGLPLAIPTMGEFGAVLLWGKADGYVLTGVLAFTAGALITTLCFRVQKKKQRRGKTAEEKQENENTPCSEDK